MIKSITTFLLAISTTSLFCQWEVKNVGEQVNSKTIHKIEFFNDSLGYAMGTKGLILRSEDSGETWMNINSNIEGDIIDFAYNNIGEIILTTYLKQGIYKSVNGFDFEQIFISEYDFPNIEYSLNDRFYLSDADVIYQSIDQGMSWEITYDFKQNGYKWGNITDFAIVNQNVTYAVGQGKVELDNTIYYSFLLKTTDGGNNWNIEKRYEWDSLGTFTDVYFKDELSGYIISSGHILKTNDGGQTWIPLPDMYGAVDLEIVNEEKIITVNRPEAYTGDATSTVFAINESFDSGSTWLNPPFIKGAHLETIQFLNDSIGFIAGDYALILKTRTCGGEIGEGYPWHIFTTSTKNLNNRPILLFPNPTSHKLFLDIPDDQMYNYAIYGMNGQAVEKGTLTGNSIDVSHLNAGTYSLSLFSKESFSSLKFVKIKE